MKKCIKCGQELANDALFCHICGEKQSPKQKFCSNCSAPITREGVFCSNCGAKNESTNKMTESKIKKITNKIKLNYSIVGFVLFFTVVSLGYWIPIIKLEWSNKAPYNMIWSDAFEYCNNLDEGGHSDWRLPTISELRTLIQNCPATEAGGECGVTDNCLSWKECENNVCRGCGNDYNGKYSKLGDTGWFWSSSVIQSGNQYHRRGVNFYNGQVDTAFVVSEHYVRCVR